VFSKQKQTTALHQGWQCNGPFKQIVLTLVLDLLTAFKMDALENWSMIIVTIEIVISLLGIVFNGLVICKRQFAWTFIVPQHPATSYSALPWVVFSLVLWLFHFLLQGTLLKMAVWNGWLSSSRGYDLSIRFGVVNSSDCHFNWEISDGNQVPFKQSYFDTRKIRNVLVTSWIFSIGFSTIPLIFWSKINGLDGSHKACLSDKRQPSVPN